MSDLLAEVDEAMRQERLQKFWDENGTFIILFVILTIFSTGAFSAYRAWDNNTKISQTSELIALQEATNYPSNIIEADLDFRSSIRGIALLSAAGTFMEQEKPEEALKLYERLAGDTKIEDKFRHLGILMSARLNIVKDEAPSNEDILASLEPVINSKSPWKPHAQIEAAILQADTNPKKSLELLNAVSDTLDLPETLYERAEKLHHVISGNSPETPVKDSSVKTN